MITASHISKSFGGIHAVRDVSFSCGEGTILGLIGPNGSGKSTLLNILTKMISSYFGTITMNGDFGRAFQEVRLWEHMTVLEHMLLMTQSHGVLASLGEYSSVTSRARAVIERVGLSEFIEKEVRFLSYGQRKLLEIGRAIATGAPNLFLDEPFAGLFPEMVERVQNIIQEEKARGASIVLIEHDMSVIRKLCDKVVVLNAGEVLCEGGVEEVLSNPQVIQAYLGA